MSLDSSILEMGANACTTYHSMERAMQNQNQGRSMVVALAWLFIVARLGEKAQADPVPAPDLRKCGLTVVQKINCCLPVSEMIVDFVHPTNPTPRVRPAAHLVDEAYIAKYIRAVGLMKSLNPSNPWNHRQQANVHCAYCAGAYKQDGYNVSLEVHGSWLFFPFHRAFIYFYERILGKLLNDDTFALPFWNWDSPEGMTIPNMYTKNASSIYDPLRDARHQAPTIADLNYDGFEPETENITRRNLVTMYRQMVSASTATLFLGSKYPAGSQPFPGHGSIELVPHNTMHVWTGDSTQNGGENMGSFYSAGRDPIFFAHHSNIDRLWKIWTGLGGQNRNNFNDTDWLDTAFLFWDENNQLVRIRVRDVLDTDKLGYTYQNVDIPWRNSKPILRPNVKRPAPSKAMIFSVIHDAPMSLEINRPEVSRSFVEKQHQEEVLVVDGIQLNREDFVKFDVYINAGANEPSSIKPDSVHFAGSFVNVPMLQDADMLYRVTSRTATITTRLMLGLTELIDDVGVDRDKSVIVTLVPRTNTHFTMGDIWIELST